MVTGWVNFRCCVLDGSSDTSLHTECFLGVYLTVCCFLFMDKLLVLSWRRRSKQVCLPLSGFSPCHRFRCTGCVSWPCAEGSRAVASVCPFRLQVPRARWGRGLCRRLVDGFPVYDAVGSLCFPVCWVGIGVVVVVVSSRVHPTGVVVECRRRHCCGHLGPYPRGVGQVAGAQRRST